MGPEELKVSPAALFAGVTSGDDLRAELESVGDIFGSCVRNVLRVVPTVKDPLCSSDGT